MKATVMRVGFNKDQRLYVIPAGKGYTTLGFDHAEYLSSVVAIWAGLKRDKGPQGVGHPSPGTLAHYREHQRLMREGAQYAKQTGDKCRAMDTPQLRGLEHRRVEVVDKYGEKRRFWVGKSTGWMPIHLEIHNTRSTGGPGIIGAPFQSVRVIR
jgi:hypothetical protein